MTTEQTKAAIAVMQAYVDKKPINVLRKSSGCVLMTLRAGDALMPNWDWSSVDFVVAPEPKYRPYNSPAEVPIGQKVRHKASGIVHMIWDAKSIGLIPSLIQIDLIQPIAYSNRTADSFLENFTFLDGKPCGILEGDQQ
jgi:hypothetical protein